MNYWNNNGYRRMHACYDSLDYEEISHASCYMTGKLIRTLSLLNSLAYLNNTRENNSNVK